VSVIFLSCIDVKQQQNDRKLCVKDLGENVVILGWFSFRKLCAKDLGENCSYLGLVLFLADFRI